VSLLSDGACHCKIECGGVINVLAAHRGKLLLCCDDGQQATLQARTARTTHHAPQAPFVCYARMLRAHAARHRLSAPAGLGLGGQATRAGGVGHPQMERADQHLLSRLPPLLVGARHDAVHDDVAAAAAGGGVNMLRSGSSGGRKPVSTKALPSSQLIGLAISGSGGVRCHVECRVHFALREKLSHPPVPRPQRAIASRQSMAAMNETERLQQAFKTDRMQAKMADPAAERGIHRLERMNSSHVRA
jgi:hypothetical protein